MDNLKQDLLVYQEDVKRIKNAILQSRYRTAVNANAEMLSLYYSIGGFVSANTRTGKWGTGVIETISDQLQGELPGLRGFSPSNMKNMRIFFEKWVPELEPNRQLPTADLSGDIEAPLIRQLATAELSEVKIMAFCRVGFTHHREILRKCKSPDEAWYYILRCADEFWSVENLKNHLRANEYAALVPLIDGAANTIGELIARVLTVLVVFRDEFPSL